MFLFTFLLYHILSHLSRGFFIFFGGISSPKGGCFVVGIIQHFFSELALVHICIPQTYTPCGRVIGQRSYLLSWASTFRGCLALSFCTLIVSHFKGFVKRFFQLFLFLWLMTPLKLVEKVSQFPHSHPWGPSVSHFAGYSLLPSWHPYCITTWAICQGEISEGARFFVIPLSIP